MNKYLLILLIVLSSCVNFPGYHTEQEIEKVPNILAPSGRAMGTYIWHNGEIIKSWYDDVNSLTDSLVKYRQKQADDFIKTAKLMK